MYQLGRILRRFEMKLRDFNKVSEKFDNYKPHPCLAVLEKDLKSLYQICIDEEDDNYMPVKPKLLIHMHQTLMVAAFNLLVNETEKKEREELDPEPVQLNPTYNRFRLGYHIQNLEYILKYQVYDDLFEMLKPMLEESFLDEDEELEVVDIQDEAIERILHELCHSEKKM